MKKLTNLLLLLMAACPAFAQKTFYVNVSNTSKIDKNSEPVVISLNNLDMDVKSAIVEQDGKEIPCQLDDLNQDDKADELCFLSDFSGKSRKTFKVTVYDNGKPRKYENKVYAELLLKNNKIKEGNKQNLYISQLTVDNGVNPYSAVHHHGVAFESELVAYRIYFDHRQTVDLYGKYRKGLELQQTQFYPDNIQKEAGFGDDVLWVGTTFGLGAMRGWDGTQPTMLTDVDKRSQRIVSRGPLRTIVEIKDKGWTPLPGMQPVDMTTLYTLYADHRDCDVNVRFNKNAGNYDFSTGIINVKNSEEFSDKNGLRGCWGTDWTVAPKDSAGHKRETVGLGIYIPSKYIASEEPANKDNYAYIIKTASDELNYKITFCSDNESFGYHNAKDWFEYLKRWRNNIENPLTVEIVTGM